MDTIAPPVTQPRTRARRWRIRLALALAVVLLALYLGISALAASILTTPQRRFDAETPATYGLAYQDVRFPARADALEIGAWYLPQPSAQRAVILVHGKDCSRTCWFRPDYVGLPRALHQRGFAVLALDLRGHGRSADARYTFGLDERRDVLGAVDWLAQQGFQPAHIGVLGQSMGAATSIGALADEPQLGALVEDCSYAEVYPIIQREWRSASGLPDFFLPSTRLMIWLLFGYDVAASRPVAEIDEIAPRPVLIIHGLDDALIPVEHARQLKAALPAAQFWAVAGAGHGRSFPTAPQEYAQRVGRFFEQSLK